MASILEIKGQVEGEHPLRGFVQVQNGYEYGGASVNFFQGAFDDGLVCGTIIGKNGRQAEIYLAHLINDGIDAPNFYRVTPKRGGKFAGTADCEKRNVYGAGVTFSSIAQLTKDEIKERKVREYLETAREKQPRDKMTPNIARLVTMFEDGEREIQETIAGLNEYDAKVINIKDIAPTIEGEK